MRRLSGCHHQPPRPRFRSRGLNSRPTPRRAAHDSALLQALTQSRCGCYISVVESCQRMADRSHGPRFRRGSETMVTGTAQQMFVGGEWRPSQTGETFSASSPATGEPIGSIPEGDRADAQGAIASARSAADGWAGLTAFERAAKMHAIGDIIESRRDELARTLTLDQGKPLASEAFDEVDELVEYWRMAAEDAKRLGGELPNSFSPGKRVLLARRARGVVGVISPWNWPYTMPAELIAPALASGNAVVWTPAPSTALCAVALAECIADADLPSGTFNLVTGPGPIVGDEIARNPHVNGVG